MSLPRPWPVRALVAFGLALTAVYAVRALGLGSRGLDDSFAAGAYYVCGIIGMIVCAWRAVAVREERAVWALVALAFFLLFAGNTIYIVLYGAVTAPVPSAADVPWLAVYLPLAVALGLRVRAAGGVRGVVLLDVLIAISALGSITAAFVVEAILAGGSPSTAELATTLAYPVADLVLITLLVPLAAANGWRFGRAAGLMAACFACWAVTDMVHAVEIVHGTYLLGGIADVGWLGPFVLLGFTAWMRPDPPAKRQAPGWPALAVPAGFALVALGMLVYAAAADPGPLAIALAAGALVFVIARFVLTFRSYLGVLRDAEYEATTDALTGLGNRRALGADLEATVAARADAQLLLFDLNGFKGYNDAFGHPAGDALLERLGRGLREAVGAAGTTYRMGGDEFCVLLGPGAGEQTVSAALAALSERGVGFAISASQGRAVLPLEASTAAEALRTADQRMYQDKRSAHGPAGEQATHALLRVLVERHPDVGDHSQGVADLAAAVARHMGVDEEQVHDVRSGAVLHDIGKAAIPDAILSKPGALDADEWAFIRRHTLVGERIVASAHALATVAKLVRSSHERWDGAGYPDGLAGDAIPLGSRIIFACDAFDAMISDRPYSPPLAFESALTELGRCAGSQFDPDVVAAFIAVSRARAASPLEASPLSLGPHAGSGG